MLRPQLRFRIPARIEEYKDRPNAVAGSDSQKLIKAFLEADWGLLPKLVLQKDAYGIHADSLG
jgi:hypothetical protein